jgi:hypothetical protein
VRRWFPTTAASKTIVPDDGTEGNGLRVLMST